MPQDRIPLLIPDLPDFSALEPWLRRIDTAKHYTNFGPLNGELCRRLESLTFSAPDSPFMVPCATTFANGTIALSTWLQHVVGATNRLILIPGITFVATAHAVLASGNRPLVADIAADNWQLTPQIARTLIDHCATATPEENIAAVIPVAVYGAPCDPLTWDRFTQETGIPVLVDAAGAFGNQAIGQTTDIAFSLHATKSLGAGEGGAVLTCDKKRAEFLAHASNFGISPDDGLVRHTGGNGKLSEYHAAVALAALERWPDQAQQRRIAMAHYLTLLAECCPTVELPPRPPHGVYTLLPVLLPPGYDAAEVQVRLDELGIQTRRWYCPPIHQHPFFASAQRSPSLHECEKLGGRLLGLPFHLQLTDHDRQRVVDALATTLNGTMR